MKKWKRFNRTSMLHESVDETIAGDDKVAGRIARFIIRVQNAFSVFMTRRTEHLSARSFKTLLIIFLITGGALNVWFVVEGLNNKTGRQKDLQAGRIQVLKNIDGETVKKLVIDGPASKQYEHLQWYVGFMDSLKADRNGHIIYDSLMQMRPGLLDSIRMLLRKYKTK